MHYCYHHCCAGLRDSDTTDGWEDLLLYTVSQTTGIHFGLLLNSVMLWHLVPYVGSKMCKFHIVKCLIQIIYNFHKNMLSSKGLEVHFAHLPFYLPIQLLLLPEGRYCIMYWYERSVCPLLFRSLTVFGDSGGTIWKSSTRKQ